MTFLFEQVIPELKERGMTDEQLDQMMVENPKALASLDVAPRAWCNGCTRAFQALSTGSIPVARLPSALQVDRFRVGRLYSGSPRPAGPSTLTRGPLMRATLERSTLRKE